MKNKIIVFFIIGFFLFSFANVMAGNLNKVGQDWDNVEQFKKDSTTSKYGKYEIRNSVLGIPFLQLSKVAELELVNNSERCSDCYADVPITLYNDGILIDKVIFKTLQKDGTWIEQAIRNYQISYPGEIKKYKTVCEEQTTQNGTAFKVCEDVDDGTSLGRIIYQEGEVVEAGTYYVRINGQKKPSRTVDWIIETNGITTNEWAVWGNISEGDDAEVILNDPDNASSSLNFETLFNATANITSGARVTNMSLWTNSSGLWSVANISEIYPSKLEVQYRLDESSGDVIDYSDNVSNGTNVGATTEQTGIINDAYNFDAGEGSYGDHFTIPQVNLDNFTINMWVNPDGNWGANSDHFCSLKDGSGATGDRIYYDNAITFQIDDSITGSGYALANHIGTWKMYTFRRNGTNIEIFLNGTSVDNTTVSTNTFSITSFAGKLNAVTAVAAFDGDIDEISIFNEAISNSEITSLYNSGSAQYPLVSEKTKTWNFTINDTTKWNVQACDSDGDCGFAENNYTVFIDSTSPQISVENPNGTINYNYIGGNETLNVTFTDTNLESCWYNYNGTNITISGCSTGVKTSSNFTLEEDNFNITIYVNDSIGNENSTFINWSYTYLENNRTHNSSSFETESETFRINVEGASSVSLLYNGTSYSTTKSGNTYSRNLQIPLNQFGNNTIQFRFDDINNSYISYQNVTPVNFTLCNSNLRTEFLNISFRDESNSSNITASIPTSTFNYWLGDGTVYKTYTYINNTENENYSFCANPNRTLNLDVNIQYKSNDYPQRIYNQEDIELTNSTTNTVLYLLSSVDGIYVTFQVINLAEQTISGVEVTGRRIIEGVNTVVAQGTTDASGSSTFWLNPDFLHTFIFSKLGYDTLNETLTPTQSTYTVQLGGTSDVVVDDYSQGISILTKPKGNNILFNTSTNFNYTINSSYWTLEEYGFILRHNNNTVIGSDSDTTGTGGTLNILTTTPLNGSIIMDYYYIINSTYINGSTTWKVYKTSDYSISFFLTRITTYIASDIFGILGDDNGYFAKSVISILLIIMFSGIISMRYGIASEQAVSALIFITVFFLNWFNFIPTPDSISIINLGDFLVTLTAIIIIASIFREELR